GLLGCDEGMGPEANARPDDLQMETEVVDLHQAKRLQIIDKSITLFSKFGFEAVKISDITDALQMGKGTFYLYFTNKRELLLACFDRLQALLLPLEMWDVVRNEKDIFLKLLHRWTGGNERYSSFSGVLSLIRTSCSWDEDEVKEKARRAYDVIIAPIRRDLEEAVAKGIVRPMDEELTAYAVLGIMEGLSFRLTLDSRYSAKDGADFIYPFLISALRADKTDQTRANKAPAISVKITDINGVAIELSEVRFNDSEHFSGKYGDAEIKVEPLQLKAIKVDSSDSRTLARLTAKDGHDLELEIDGDTLIKGYTSFGGLQIAFRKVSQLVFI
ncbi:MAG: TetR/AcrR family transcriptional regulator, partial [Deltaproteobacteria bacterium]|nr:TetR/AcrR family transcriptional regulator [Deltaproteobacteria bacterium]